MQYISVKVNIEFPDPVLGTGSFYDSYKCRIRKIGGIEYQLIFDNEQDLILFRLKYG